MRLFKFFILCLLANCQLSTANSQYVQSMGYKDYSFWEKVNIGNRGAKTTNDAAYLELGKPVGSNKGFLLPRGNKDSIVLPTYGMVFYNNPDSAIYYFDGVAWKNLSTPEGGPGDGNNYANSLGFNTGTDALTLGRNGLGNLSASIPLSIKLNKVDTTAKWLHKIAKSHDSVFYYINGVPTFAFKDSIGAGGGSGGTATVKAFPTINALKVSTFHTTPGDLKADILDGGRSFKWNGESTASDDGGVTTVVPTTGVGAWERIFRGVVRADEVGIKNDGTDQTTALNSLFNLSTVKEVVFDNGSVTIGGTVDFKNKRVVFENGAKLTGAGTLKNILPYADYKTQIFDVTLNTNASIIATKVSVMWWGAAPQANWDTGNGADNYNAFTKAIASQKLQPSVYIPGADTTNGHLGYFYYSSRPIIINSRIELFGDGQDKSIIYIPGDSAGVRLIWGSSGSHLHDFKINGNYGSSPPGFNSSTAHGLWIESNSNVIERIAVTYFSGDGIRVSGDVGYTPYSNANNNKIKDLYTGYNGRAGLYFVGGDANNCYVQSVDATGNAQVNFWDASFLGNMFYACHAASAAMDNSVQKSVVTHGGVVYLAKWNSLGIEPGVTSGWENYWNARPDLFPPFSEPWNSSTQYYLTAGYYATDPNQIGLFDGCYSEGDQNTFINQSNSMIINGFAGAYGNLPGAIGMRQGILTSQNFQVYDITSTASLRLEKGAAPTLTWNEAGAQPYGFVGSASGGLIKTNWAGGIGGSGNVFFASPSWSGWASWLGRDRSIQGNHSHLFQVGGTPIAYYDNSTNARFITFGSSAPTTGDFGVGDVVLNTDATASTLYWQCSVASVAGNGGTWVARTGAGTPVTPGGSSGDIQFNNGGSFGGFGDWNGSTLNIPGNIYLSAGGAGAASLIDFGAGYSSPNIYFYNGGATQRYGAGIGAAELQFFMPGDGGAHVSFNYGGDMQGTTVNEIMRIDPAGLKLWGLGTTGNKIVGRDASGYLYNTGIDPANIIQTTGGGTITGTPTGSKYLRDDFTWQAVSGGSGVTTMAAIGSSPNANGASISGSTLTLQPANGSFGGVVTTGAQTFEGTKTFNQNILSNGSGVFSGEVQSTYGSFTELGTQPTTPTGRGIFWAKSDGTPHYLNDAGVDVQLGGSSSSSTIATLNVNTTDVSNSGTSETDLMSYTLPAGKLVNVGDRLVIEADFSTASNANNKTLIFYFGGYTHTQSPSTIASGTTIRMRFTVIKTGTGTQKITREFLTSFSTSPGTATASVSDTGTIVIKFTGTSGTASSDITQTAMIITYYPAP